MSIAHKSEIYSRFILGDIVVSQRPAVKNGWPIPLGFGLFVADYVTELGRQGATAWQSLKSLENWANENYPEKQLILAGSDWTEIE